MCGLYVMHVACGAHVLRVLYMVHVMYLTRLIYVTFCIYSGMHALYVVYVVCVTLASFVACVMHTRVSVCKRARLHARMSVCTHARMHVGMRACLRTHNLYVCVYYKGSRHSATFGATPELL